ncbi:MAG: autoinducer binding domain-containing protein [Burkholderia vietnamiensis]|nr:autoinducer binding domain-containing protein [Burkholderia vietnamiensis]
MSQWRESLLASMEQAETASDAFDGLAPVVRALGFEYHAYVLRVTIPITRPASMEWNNFPQAWRAHYAQKRYQHADPVLHYGQACTRPMPWPGPLAGHDAFWRDAADFGLRHGWSQTLRDHRGAMGTFSLVRGGPPISPEELRRTEPEMIWLCQFVHATMSNLIVSDVMPSGAMRLSLREKEVLHWTAEGKTAAEVAAILLLTERNVGFHIQNAMDKLDATNKTHATVKAAMLGLIPVRD